MFQEWFFIMFTKRKTQKAPVGVIFWLEVQTVGKTRQNRYLETTPFIQYSPWSKVLVASCGQNLNF